MILRNLTRPAMLLAAAATGPAFTQDSIGGADPLAELSRMTLEQLANVEVTSVSKSAQSLSSAPASIYVITREEIVRLGVTSVPEALRLAPNMQTTQLTASEYANGARGFGGAPDLQNFSNKILILIDGRSVYSPLFSGVAYDMQDVLMDDVERIEIISGPGATLWGANAMNGVINIITKSAADTAGTLMHVEAGPEEQGVGARHGGRFGDDAAYRVYAKWFDRGESELEDGSGAGDDWRKLQAGFRVDATREHHRFTLQGDYQDATQAAGDFDDVDFSGANLVGRWTHTGRSVTTRTQVFLDRVDRGRPPSGIAFDLDTVDVELQQSVAVGSRHQLVWGLGRRYHRYRVENNDLAFIPDRRTLHLSNVFLQDTMRLADELRLTAGIKFEDNHYSGWTAMPDLRLSWAPDESMLLWLAGAHAIRAPTPFDVDVVEFIGGAPFIVGNPDFEPEKVDAYELGFRTTPNSALVLNASVFYNEYDDLRTIEFTPVTLLPLHWGNLMEGKTYGVEAWATWQVNSWWRLSPGLRTLHKDLRFKPGSSQVGGLAQAGNDPSGRFYLKSSMDFGKWGIDAMLRHVKSLPEPVLDAYTELSARVSWRVNDQLELAVKGFNLLNETHREYPAPAGREIPRSLLVELRYVP
jgi:iron complex outermembrane receptor protein